MQPSQVQFREIRKSDLASFEGVIQQGLGPLERSTGLDEVAVAQFRTLRSPSTWAMLTLLRALGRAPVKVFVGVEGGRVVGTASVILLPNAAYVFGVATDSAARRRGIATQLMGMTHEEAKARGKKWMALDVESENEAAIKIYRKLGYVDIAHFDWYVGQVGDQKGGGASPISKADGAEVVAWISHNLPEQVREPLPPSWRRLSHLEIIIQTMRAPTATWQMRGPGGIEAAARGIYIPLVKTGYSVLLLPESDAAAHSQALVTQCGEWIRSRGGSRMVVVARRQGSGLDIVLPGLGLEKAVTTNLMVRPSPNS